jgi:hypothetical protein
VIESVSHFLQSAFGLSALAVQQIDDGQIQVGDIPILTMVLCDLLELFAADGELSIVEVVARLSDPFGMGRTSSR